MTRARMPRPHEVAAAQRDPRLLRALSERDADPGWRTRGVCRTVDPETFFPAPSEPADAAVALCRTCTVQGPCLAWALRVGDCHGVWGATTPRERRAMLVAWRAEPAELPDALPLGVPVNGLAELRPMDGQLGIRPREPKISLLSQVSEPAPLVLDPHALTPTFEAELSSEFAHLGDLVEQLPV